MAQKHSAGELAPGMDVAKSGHATHGDGPEEKLAQDPAAQAQSRSDVAPGAELEPGGQGLQRSGAGSPYRLALQMHAASPPEAPAAELDPEGQGLHSTKTVEGYGGGRVSFPICDALVATVELESSGAAVAPGLAANVSFLQKPALQRQPEMFGLHTA